MGKKKLTTSNKIAAAVAAMAVTGAFGAGAYAIVQDGSAFDPKGFASAYNKTAQDEQQGFRATQSSTDAQANRHKDDAKNNDTSAEKSSQRDAFSNLPDNGSGTTAVSVDPNAKAGTTTSTDNGTASDGNGNGGASVPSTDDDGNKNDNGSNDNSGTTPSDPDPSTPDNPGGSTDNPGGNTGGNGDSGNTDKPGDNTGGNTNRPGDNTGGNTGGNGDPGNAGGDTGNADKPGEAPNKTPDVAKGEDTEYDSKGTGGGMGDSSYSIVNDKTTNTDEDVRKRGDEYAVFIDSDTSADNGRLYVGKLASAWDIFVSMNTWYVDNNLTTYYWACDKKDYPEYGEKYFKINYVAWDDTVVEAKDFPFTVPDGPFTVNITYRVGPNAEPHTVDVTYEPFTIRNYIINPFVESDVADILLTSSESAVNLAYWNEKVINSANELGKYGAIIDDEGYLKQLLIGWKETSTDGENDKAVPDFFTAPNGRHVYAPSGFMPINPDYKAKLKTYWGDNNGAVTPDNSGNELLYLQTLTGLEGKQFADTLTVQSGIQSIDIEQGSVFDFDVPSLLVNYLEIPSSVRYVNIASNKLAVEEGFKVSDDNPFYRATDDGVLTNIAGTEYLAVPTHKKELDISDGVTSVSLSKYNNTLETITIETESPSKLPTLDNAHLNGCKIVVKNKDVLKKALVEYASLLDSDNGNYLSVEGEGDFSIKDGIVSSNGELIETTDDSISIVDISGVGKIRKGAFVKQSDPEDPDAQPIVSNVTTLVLGESQELEFEEGCFAGSAVKYIVCTNDEQKAAIESKLATVDTGSNVVKAVVKQTATDGSVYFSSQDDDTAYAALLSAPADVVSFDGTLTAQDGSEVDITAIGPRAFKDCTSLKWLPLKESVNFIGTGAFSGCSSLEGLFIGNEDEITVESDIFSGCDNVAFVASRATNASFASSEVPSYYTVLYCPTGSTGYTSAYQAFTPESDITDFTLIPQEDGSYLLYGCSARFNDDPSTPWLCLSAATSTSGEVKLPSTTLEIFNRAFAEKKNSFTINWDDLADLSVIDFQAFYNSGLTGAVSFTNRISIGKETFNNCSGITSVVATGSYFSTGDFAFAGCAGLESVEINSEGGSDNGNNFGAGVFNSCDALKSVKLTDPDPATLTLYDYNYAYTFNFDWDDNEDCRGIIDIPETSLEDYLNAWVYPFAGYASYSSLEGDVAFDLYIDNDWVWPDEAEIREGVLEKLLPVENKLRMLLGADPVEEVTVDLPELTHDETCDGFTFSVKDGVATMTSAPDSIENGVIDFNQIIPESWSEVTIPAGVLNSCAGVSKIILSDNIETIENGAFEGLGDIELVVAPGNIAYLKGGSFDEPYSFGAKSVRLSTPEAITDDDAKQNLIKDYLMSWTVNSLGCKEIEDFYWEASSLAYDLDKEPEDIEVCRVIDTEIMAQENVFRRMFGLEEVTDLNALTTSYAKDYCNVTYPTEPEKTEDPEDPNTNDTPKGDNAGGEQGGNQSEQGSQENSGTAAEQPGDENKDTNEGGSEEDKGTINDEQAGNTQGGSNSETPKAEGEAPSSAPQEGDMN